MGRLPVLGAFENAFTHAPIGMALVDLAGQVLRVNDAMCRITGFTGAEVRARAFRDLSDPQDVDVDALQRVELLDGHRPTYQIEKRYRHAWGYQVWVLLSVSLVRDDEGRPLYFIAQVQDIAERKELEGRLEQLVDHDFLTALFKPALGRRPETKSAAATAVAGPCCWSIWITPKGQRPVRPQSRRHLTQDRRGGSPSRMRQTDVLARLGGDEFGIILPQVDSQQAELVAEGIVKTLRRQTAMLAEHQIPVTASVGIALFDGRTSIEILSAADLAMYEAKEAGRDRFAVYRPSTGMPPRLSSRLSEAERIQCALTHDRLELLCQPILDLATNEISQYELLLRLRTEDGQLLPPSAFLYVAERFGTILAIDAWVVRQAIALIATHARAGRSLTLNVNISAKSIGNPQLIAIIDRALADSGIDPACLVFELTETAAIGNIDHAKTFTTELRVAGADSRWTTSARFRCSTRSTPVRLFQDRWRLHSWLRRQSHRPARRQAIVGIARAWGRKPWRNSSPIRR
jgi:PAS domain S-box-containing protein